MNKKRTIHIINQTVADTKYIKDDITPCYNLNSLLTNWLIIYMLSNFILCFIQIMGTSLCFNEKYYFFPLVRILYILLFLSSLIYYIYFVCKRKISIKENDFIKMYIIIPILLAFTKIIFPISYYLNTEILLGLINTISLDLITLILSSLLLRFYFKDNHLNIFVLYNVVIYLLNIIVIYSFSSLNSRPLFLINMYNFVNFLQDFGFFVLAHFTFILIYMRKIIKNEKIYI